MLLPYNNVDDMDGWNPQLGLDLGSVGGDIMA